MLHAVYAFSFSSNSFREGPILKKVNIFRANLDSCLKGRLLALKIRRVALHFAYKSSCCRQSLKAIEVLYVLRRPVK